MKHQRLSWVLVLVLVWVGVALLVSSVLASESELIPRKVLLGNPLKASPQISPDGKFLSYLAPLDNVLNVWVRTVGAEDDRPVTKDDNRGVRAYFWAADSKHIMYLQDVGGNENWRLYGVNLETDEIKDFTPFDGVQVRITDRNKHFPNELLIAMNKENPRVHDVYHLDLSSGELRLVAKNPGNYIGWVTDSQFKVRGALVATPEGGFNLLIRKNEAAEWEKLVSWSAEDSLNSGPVTFSKDGDSIYLLDSRDVDAGRLVKLNIPTSNIEVIAEDPQYDVGGVMIHPDTYEIQAVTFYRARKELVVLDESIREDFETIGNLDHGDFFVTDRDNADDTWLVAFTKDNGPVSYYAFERETQKGVFLFDHMPDLKRYTLASMEPISLISQDGLTIHGYITYPPGKGRANLPMVLNVHGGPWYRDTWGYNPEAQWLANRGYVCLQVNFRGSTGYGKDFVNAGNKEWGGKMHDDLVDAVNWAIDAGIADPEKIAIYGGSYGGYAALVGATFTPDLFCCAVDVVGPSNLITWIETIPPYWSTLLATIYKRVGNPDTEEEFLKSRSPLFKVDKIKIPILIAQGANDPRVKQAESEQIVEAMKKKGIEYEYMLFPDEGHGFAKPENRLKFYAVAEKFLAKYLGGRYEGSAQ
ncbi:S9 family peptidase [Candidatus Aerophobetes bacterium Ae_b3a]|nr:MAG: S9 family peptidase [Candidatus Aerophobetes bacterium Ae_b3a]